MASLKVMSKSRFDHRKFQFLDIKIAFIEKLKCEGIILNNISTVQDILKDISHAPIGTFTCGMNLEAPAV